MTRDDAIVLARMAGIEVEDWLVERLERLVVLAARTQTRRILQIVERSDSHEARRLAYEIKETKVFR